MRSDAPLAVAAATLVVALLATGCSVRSDAEPVSKVVPSSSEPVRPSPAPLREPDVPLPEACRFPEAAGRASPAGSGDTFLPGTGAPRVLVIPVDFPDAPANDSVKLPALVGLLDDTTDLVAELSHEKLDLQLPLHQAWVRMPNPSVSYGLDDGDATYDDHRRLFTDAAQVAGDIIDASDAGAVMLVAASGAAIFGAAAFNAGGDPVPTPRGAIVQGVHVGADSLEAETLAHESLHLAGLPDLYPSAAQVGTPEAAEGFVGGWDLMGDVRGFAPEPLAWQQWQLGWVADDQVTCLEEGTADVALAPVSTGEGQQAVVVPTGPTSALIVESRRSHGAPAGECGSGVLVYRLDTTRSSGEGPLRVVDPRASDGAEGPPESPCGLLGLAVLAAGDAMTARWSDPVTGITVEALLSDDEGDVVRVTRPSA